MKGIIVASFGSSHREDYEASIGKIRDRVKAEYPEVYVNESISSNNVRNKVEKRDGFHYYNMGEALLDMENRGIKDIYVLSLYVIKGVELEKIIKQAEEYNMDGRLNIRFTKALLEDEEMISKTAGAMVKYKSEDKDAVVFMGHGSYHDADITYEKLQNELDRLESHVYVGTLEGSMGIDSVLSRLAWTGEKNILLAPMLLLSGDHAKNDMAGDEDSWRTKLEEQGCNVEVLLKGMCELDFVNDIFMESLRSII